MKKIRVDHLLVQKGLAPTRSKAQSYILAGVVLAGPAGAETQRVDKASELFSAETEFIIKQKDHEYVSRGGVKLKAALDHFKLDVVDKTCLDVGVSTGGFTDCLLRSGAKKIYGVDVGRGQLDWKLRTDPRVILFEKINFRNFDLSQLNDPIDLIVVDVSFISLTKILPKILEIVSSQKLETTSIVTLIKPQFEVGPGHIGKGGIVRDEKARVESVERVRSEFEKSGFEIVGILPSPITGQDGNVEYLMCCQFTASPHP